MSISGKWLWKGDRLWLNGRFSGFSVVVDERYPQMWRVRRPDGSLSDMVNRTRAKDAALAMLDRAQRGGQTPAGAAPARLKVTAL
jgi:hypothetical protein